MATSMSMFSSLILTCLALLVLLATAAQARPLPPENSRNKLMIIMIDNIGSSTETREMTGNDHSDDRTESSVKGKTAPPPPSPTLAPPIHNGELEQPPQLQRAAPESEVISMLTDFGKTPKWPPSPKPKPAPSKHQDIIEQPIQQRSGTTYQL